MLPVKDWPHAPVHRLGNFGVYMVTGATLHKQHFFKQAERLSLLENSLLSLANQYKWQLEAWAVFVNHYHIIALASEQSAPLKNFLNHLHSESARELNNLDRLSGRKVWYNFWDTKLTYERSYLARLNYVHQNAVKQDWLMSRINIPGVRLLGLNVPRRLRQSRRSMPSKLIS